jgi:hypothetical protein
VKFLHGGPNLRGKIMNFLHGILLLLTLCIVSLNSYGAIWEVENSWSQEWETRYSEWMKSPKVHSNIFAKGQTYQGGLGDCADTAYALRIIFSFENKLPFSMNHPMGARRGQKKILSQSSKIYDRISSPERRVVKFIKYIGDSVGSVNLNLFDTFPVRLQTIHAGDIFSYKKGRRRTSVRHVYTLKDVNRYGNFDVIYSTQALARHGAPLTYSENKTFVNLPHPNWGFKRFYWPQHLTSGPQAMPSTRGYSLEQYGHADRMRSKDFFKFVKQQIKTDVETPDKVIKRHLNNICKESTARIEYVNQGIRRLNELNGRCMDYRDYDTFSTPSRDTTLRATFSIFKEEYLEMADNGELREVSNLNRSLANAILFSENLPNVEEDLMDFCPINYRGQIRIHLHEMYRRINEGLLSFHPNDGIELRWGERSGPRTSCRAFYE